jgi:hypothetical protein
MTVTDLPPPMTPQPSRGWRKLGRRLLEPSPGTSRRMPLGPTAGIRLEAQPNMTVDLWVGLYESELSRHFRAICQPGMRCVEVGSLNALYALMFAKLCRAPVVAYEPDPDAHERCKRNLALNPDLARLVTLRSVAVGPTTGGGLVTLDDDLEGAHVDFILIDVDRAEAGVLAGATSVLMHQRPRLIVECHSAGLERACGDLLLDHGYQPRVVTQRRLLPQNRRLAHNTWLVA